jgi:hypothetical protein
VSNEYNEFIEFYYETAGSTQASSKKKCFAGTEVVQLDGGLLKPLSEVVVGDSILSADREKRLTYSKVIAVPHRPNDDLFEFVRIQLESLKDLKVTSTHILPVYRDCNDQLNMELVPANVIERGMCLLTVHGPDAVTSIASVVDRGLYSAVTEKEFIVVNGIVASPFADNHFIGNAYYSMLKLFPNIFSVRWLFEANEYIGSVVGEL